jgi:putative transposase
MKGVKQLELPLPRRGGKRRGAGRPRTLPHPGLLGVGVPHVPRPEFAARNPLHVTQRMRPDVGNLRTQRRLELLKRAFHAGSGHLGMQVVHFSVQGNHLHLIVEAEGRDALSRGMKGLAVRVAVALNRSIGRRGTVFADRYHARVMSSPRDVANTLRYVFENYRHHARETLAWSWKDRFASSAEAPLPEPSVWLLRLGWRKQMARIKSRCSARSSPISRGNILAGSRELLRAFTLLRYSCGHVRAPPSLRNLDRLDAALDLSRRRALDEARRRGGGARL